MREGGPHLQVREGGLLPQVTEGGLFLQVREGGPHLEVREGDPHHLVFCTSCCHQQVRAALSRSLPLHLQQSNSRPQHVAPELQSISCSRRE